MTTPESTHYLKDPQALKEHLQDTAGLVYELRTMMVSPLTASYESEKITSTAGGSKPPLSIDLLALSDDEVAAVGLLAQYCKIHGQMRLQRLDGTFTARGGVHTGLSTRPGAYTAFTALCRVLSHRTAEIVEIPEIDPYLEYLASVRTSTLKVIPQSAVIEFFTQEEAAAYMGVTVRTLRSWVTKGWLLPVEDYAGDGRVYRSIDLKAVHVPKPEREETA